MRISDWSSDVCSSDLVGQAHESAIKESETDAMKRALMTFGNQFGLALYDKTRANVCAPDPEPVTDEQLMRLQNTADDVGADLQAFCKIMGRSEEHQSELQELMRISYAVRSLNKNQYDNFMLGTNCIDNTCHQQSSVNNIN